MIFVSGKTVYWQDTDTAIQADIAATRIGILTVIPLTEELDPDFDLTRSGVHKDLIRIGGLSTYYVYSVIERELYYDEIPVSIEAKGSGVFKLNDFVDYDAVMTVTTDTGYVFDLFLDNSYIENFDVSQLGEYETTIRYERNGVTVTAPYKYSVVE